MSDTTAIVFVVDDDISVRESLELLIRNAGWQPETFASAQDFLSRPRVLVPSCLVLEVSLPDLNGLDLQKRVAADWTDLPIIFITGYGDIPITVQAMKAGGRCHEMLKSGLQSRHWPSDDTVQGNATTRSWLSGRSDHNKNAASRPTSSGSSCNRLRTRSRS